MLRKFPTKRLFDAASREGIEALEIFMEASEAFDIRVGNGKVEHFSLAENKGFSARGICGKSMGYVYTEDLHGFQPEELVKELKENAEIMEAVEKEEIHFDHSVCKKADLMNSTLKSVPHENKILFALEMEKESKSLDNRIEAVDYCLYGETQDSRLIQNTKGLDLSEEKNMAFAYLSVVAREGDRRKSGSAYKVSNRFGDFNAKDIAQEAVQRALEQLDAQSMASGPRRTLLSNEAAASLLQAFVPAFSAENVQRNLSLLKDRIDTSIGASALTIVDDPFLRNGAGSRTFDDEGTCTLRKEVVREGVLKTFLHNKKTGKKDAVPSTGNAFKASYKAPVSIAPTNFFINPGEESLEKALEFMGEGVYITDLQGLHAGVDTVSGDFSLSARGFRIEGGRKARAIHQIAIAGNFFEMLSDIEIICDDLKFIMPGQGQIGSPGLLIKKLDISGE